MCANGTQELPEVFMICFAFHFVMHILTQYEKSNERIIQCTQALSQLFLCPFSKNKCSHFYWFYSSAKWHSPLENFTICETIIVSDGKEFSFSITSLKVGNEEESFSHQWWYSIILQMLKASQHRVFIIIL